MDKISVIVPCYNEEESLPLFYQEVVRVLKNMDEIEYELLFIDDGSSDGTGEEIKRLAAADHHVRYVIFSRNFGKEAGMYAGLREATGNYCVIMDADLQHPPALLPKMYLAVSQEGYDCCGGKRMGREGDGAVRSFLSRAFYKVGKGLTHLEMCDGYGDFRMMSRRMVEAILEIQEYNRYMKGIFSFVGFQTKWIPYDNVERSRGQSKWSFKSLLHYAMEGILSFSTAPLKLAGVMSGLLLAGSLLVVLAGVLQTISGMGNFGGWQAIMAVVLLIGGLQMLVIYILGAYLSKDYLENKRRPIYIVKEKR